MGNLNLFFPLTTLGFVDFFQIIFLYIIFYIVLKGLRNTRAWVVTKGIIIVLVIYGITKLLSLDAISFLFEQISGIIVIAIVIMFQPELRKLLEKLGKNTIIKDVFKRKNNDNSYWFSEKTIAETTKAAFEMGKVKTGALIVFERAIPLDEWSNTGIDINADLTWQLYVNIFEKNTPLHDGAVIISNNSIKSATCYLPLSDNRNIDKSMGTRHRAGIGIAECTDAIVVIVSEETGNVSYIENGNIERNVQANRLNELLFAAREKNDTIRENLNDRKKKNFNNLFKNKNNILKVIATIISVFVWFFAINANDNVKTMTFNNIPVNIANDQLISDTGFNYSISSGDKINVTIQARRSILEQFTENDIIAIADFSEMSITNAVPISVTFNEEYSNNIKILNISERNMKLELETTESVEIPVEVTLTGKPKNGYYATLENISNDTIIVSGPKSIVNVLEVAKVTVNIDGKDIDFSAVSEISIYDRNGTKIDLNTIETDTTKITSNVEVYEIQNIPLKVLEPTCPTNSICSDFEYEIEPKTVPVIGDDEVLENLKYIEVQAGLNTTLTTDWSYKLPLGIRPATNDTTVIIKSTSSIYEYTTFSMSSSQIELKKNVDNNYEIVPSIITFYAYIDVDTKENINPQDLISCIDVSTISENNRAKIIFNEIDGIIFDGTQTVELKEIDKVKR